jgi:hypothetical protein
VGIRTGAMLGLGLFRWVVLCIDHMLELRPFHLAAMFDPCLFHKSPV